MNDWNEEIRDKWRSASQRVKEEGILQLLKHMGEWVNQYFWKRTGDREATSDLTQQLFTNLWKQVLDGPAIADPEHFARRTARNLLIEYRKNKQKQDAQREITDELQQGKDQVRSAEKEFETGWEFQRIRALCLHLPTPEDRAVMILKATGHSDKETHILTQLPHGSVRYRIRKNIEHMRRMWPSVDDLVTKPSEWEQRVGGGPEFGVYFLNVAPHPQNLEIESQRILCEALDLKSTDELDDVFAASIRIHPLSKLQNLAPEVWISYLPHRSVTFEGMVEGTQKLPYVEFRGRFVKQKGDQLPLLQLIEKQDVLGQMIKKQYQDQSGIPAFIWRYEVAGERSLYTYKPFEPSLFHLISKNARRKKRFDFVYRPLPPTQRN